MAQPKLPPKTWRITLEFEGLLIQKLVPAEKVETAVISPLELYIRDMEKEIHDERRKYTP